jgi:NADH dehydrogenase
MSAVARVLVLGGTGFVGRSVCERLVDRSGGGGLRITVPTRRLAHARDVQFLPTLDIRQADVHDDAQLEALVAGHDAVVNLIAILHGDAAAFDRVHVQLPRRLGEACRRLGVRRVVHVSALGVGADAPSLYLRSKAGGEAALQAVGLDLTVLRPSVIFGAEDRFLNLFARLQAVAPIVPLAGSGARLQPVWVEDVAEAIARCALAPNPLGRTFECTGPQIYTLAHLMRIAGRLAGHERPVLPLPDALGRLQAGVMELLSGEPLMSRDNLRSLAVPNVASGELPGLDALGITPAALEAVAPGYLAPGQGIARLDHWRAGRAGRPGR